MYVKTRNKILRKYDADIWMYMYIRRRKNKFFQYFKLSIIDKLRKGYKTGELNLLKVKKRVKVKIKNLDTLTNSTLNEKFTLLKNFRKFFKRVNFSLSVLFLKLLVPHLIYLN